MMDRLRVTVIAAVFFLPLGGLEARLAWMQLINREAIVGRALTSRQHVTVAPAARGRILDRNGKVLAHDERSFDLWLVLDEFERDAATRAGVELIAKEGLQEELESIYERINCAMDLRPDRERPAIFRRERRTPYLLKRALNFEQAYAIETAPDRFPGCLIREGLRRSYPFGTAAAHVVGYIGRVNDVEYARLIEQDYFTKGFDEFISEGDIAILERRGAFKEKLLGRAGVEKSYDERLRGRDGLRILDRDPETGAKSWIELMPAVPGEDVELAIDIDVQRDVEAILADAQDECPHKIRAHAVVLDPVTGEIKAIASNVGYDPNDFIPPTKAEKLKAYFDDPWKPLFAHAWADHKQSGSVFKVLTAVAGLEEGAATTSTTTDCNGHYDARNTGRFNCWTVASHAAPHGEQNVTGALSHSCNIFFFTAGEKMGLEPMWRWGDRFGYGRKTGIDLPGEVPGVFPSPDKNPRWTRTDSLNLAIGQGSLTVTPLQIAKTMAAIANGGTLVTPHVARDFRMPAERVPLAPATLDAIRKGLADCTHVRGGTAYDSGMSKFGGVGKTGSAQRGSDPRLREHPQCWFSGYFPLENPKYVIVVLCEEAKGGGGHVAAPLAGKIAERLCR